MFLHYFLHFGFVVFIAYFWDKENWLKCYILLLSTMIVDLDHLFVSPIFCANRCSIGFHYLHQPIPIFIYVCVFFLIKHKYVKLFFLGLLFHMFTDMIDCFLTFSKCESCFEESVVYEWVEPFLRNRE